MDYPAGQVRWTEGRNFEAVLDLLAAGRLQVADLVTHTFDIGEAAAAYRLIEERAEPYLAIQLSYPAARGAPPMPGGAAAAVGRRRATLVAGGGLDRGGRVLDRDAAARVPGRRVRPVHRRRLGQRHHRRGGRPSGTASPRRCRAAFRVIDDPDTDVVVIATPHDTHAELAVLALKAGGTCGARSRSR